MTIAKLKSELESTLRIIKWNPTEEQLEEIGEKLSKLKGTPSKTEVEKVVLGVVGSYECISLDGIDTTDTTALLALAIEATKKKSSQ